MSSRTKIKPPETATFKFWVGFGTWTGITTPEQVRTVTDLFPGHGMFFDRVTNFVLKPKMVKNAKKYAVLISRYKNVIVQNVEFDTFSDGIHLLGPGEDIFIENIRGKTGDDMVAFGVGDYADYQIDLGGFKGATVRTLRPRESLTAVKLYAVPGNDFGFEDFQIEDVEGTVTSFGFEINVEGTGKIKGISYRDIKVHTGFPSTSAPLFIFDHMNGGNVQLDNINDYGKGPVIRVLGEMGKLKIKGINAPNLINDEIIVTGSVKELIIDGLSTLFATKSSAVRVDGTVNKLSATNVFIENGRRLVDVTTNGVVDVILVNGMSLKNCEYAFYINGTVGRLVANGIDLDTLTQSFLQVAKTLEVCELLNVHGKTGSSALVWQNSSATALKFKAANVYLKQFGWVVRADATADVEFNGAEFDTIANYLAQSVGATGNLRIRGNSIKHTGTAAGMNLGSGAVGSVNNPDWPCNVALLTPQAWDRASNTSAAVTLNPNAATKTGLVIYDPDNSAWRHM